jgi:hypothetical protein
VELLSHMVTMFTLLFYFTLILVALGFVVCFFFCSPRV